MSNTVHINKIKQGLNRVKELGHSDDSFKVCGQTLAVRTLSRPQLREINLYCKPYLDDAQEQDTTFAMTDWMQKVREETLAHAIIQIDDVDLRGVEFIEMEDDEGNPIKKQKHVVVREILQNWANSTLSVVYDKYREVVEKADEDLQESVQLESDQAKVSRIKTLQKKMNKLKRQVSDELLREEGLLEDESNEESDGDSSDAANKVDKESIKKQMYSPTKDDAEVQLGKVAPRPGENEEQQISEAERKYQQEQDELQQQHNHDHDHDHDVDKEELTYVDEFGNPLTGQELEAAKAQDELLKERNQKRKEASAQTKKRRQRPQSRRQPLNTVDADIKNQQQPKTVRSNKSDRPGEDQIVSSFDDEPAPLRRNQPQQGPDWGQVADPQPSPQQNPDYQPSSTKDRDESNGGDDNS